MGRLFESVRKEFPFLVGTSALVWQILFFVIPLFCIIQQAFHGRFGEYFFPFFDSVFVAVIARSLWMAFSNSFLCLFFAYPLTYFLAFKAGRLRIPGLFLLIVPSFGEFAIPELMGGDKFFKLRIKRQYHERHVVINHHNHDRKPRI